MWEIYELCQLGLRDSSLVRAWKIGLNNFPFTAAISCLHLGERPPTREHINRPVCLWACKFLTVYASWVLGVCLLVWAVRRLGCTACVGEIFTVVWTCAKWRGGDGLEILKSSRLFFPEHEAGACSDEITKQIQRPVSCVPRFRVGQIGSPKAIWEGLHPPGETSPASPHSAPSFLPPRIWLCLLTVLSFLSLAEWLYVKGSNNHCYLAEM